MASCMSNDSLGRSRPLRCTTLIHTQPRSSRPQCLPLNAHGSRITRPRSCRRGELLNNCDQRGFFLGALDDLPWERYRWNTRLFLIDHGLRLKPGVGPRQTFYGRGAGSSITARMMLTGNALRAVLHGTCWILWTSRPHKARGCHSSNRRPLWFICYHHVSRPSPTPCVVQHCAYHQGPRPSAPCHPVQWAMGPSHLPRARRFRTRLAPPTRSSRAD